MGINRSLVTQKIFYNQCSPEWAEKGLLKLSPESLRAFTTPVILTPGRLGKVEKHYIKCSEDRALLSANQEKMIIKKT